MFKTLMVIYDVCVMSASFAAVAMLWCVSMALFIMYGENLMQD